MTLIKYVDKCWCYISFSLTACVMEIITVIGLTFGRFVTGIPIIETNIIKLDIHELFEVQNGDEHYVNIKWK